MQEDQLLKHTALLGDVSFGARLLSKLEHALLGNLLEDLVSHFVGQLHLLDFGLGYDAVSTHPRAQVLSAEQLEGAVREEV